MIAPIAVFAFNRPTHLHRTLDALGDNYLASKSSLTIFCDGPRNETDRESTEAVRGVAKRVCGFASVRVVSRERNMGCAGSIIDGLAQMFAIHERLIIIEDDILTSKYTLYYLNTALDYFENKRNIFAISAWAPPRSLFPLSDDHMADVYYVPRFHCWGWASWGDRFRQIDWKMTDYTKFNTNIYLRRLYAQQGVDLPEMLDMQMAGKLDTWDIRADFSRFMSGKVCVNPRYSYTTNTGMGCGTHTTRKTSIYDNDLDLAIKYPKMCIENIYDFDLFHRYASLHTKQENLRLRLKKNIKSIFRGK